MHIPFESPRCMQCRGHERMVVGLATIGAVSTITTKVESSNPVHGEVSSTNNTDRHNITVILLEVALNTTNHQFQMHALGKYSY